VEENQIAQAIFPTQYGRHRQLFYTQAPENKTGQPWPNTMAAPGLESDWTTGSVSYESRNNSPSTT
jgi:hypothetical protein